MKILKASCFFLFFLSCILSQNASAVDKVPVTTSGISILKLCMLPGQSLRHATNNFYGMTHCKLENIILKAYREAVPAHKTNHSILKMLNAGISGKTTGKGPNLLTFATMHEFRRLAIWAMYNGADINRMDLDGKTPLSIAMDDQLTYMKQFVFKHGAGVKQEASGYALLSYMVHTSMADSMDRYIRYYMENGYLSPEDMNGFEVNGRRFEHFLAINGFSESLEYRLHYNLSKKQAENRIFIRDTRGNDVLQAAIQSLNYDTVQTVLKLSNYNINQRIPKFPNYENGGDKPLDTARRLQASPALIKLLISYKANPHRY